MLCRLFVLPVAADLSVGFVHAAASLAALGFVQTGCCYLLLLSPPASIRKETRDRAFSAAAAAATAAAAAAAALSTKTL